ncbi:hypothetical protein NDU88_003105 [Pleurodeles waltl]|uniref:Uncharacterized protein n=1 Tax=Pleurodeles waltl TaxID=8319 RepID=A0AAV7NQ05_PLEWA|nr:hypothetical protein NDU88_003105 [Pleurodeles waltl]
MGPWKQGQEAGCYGAEASGAGRLEEQAPASLHRPGVLNPCWGTVSSRWSRGRSRWLFRAVVNPRGVLSSKAACRPGEHQGAQRTLGACARDKDTFTVQSKTDKNSLSDCRRTAEFQQNLKRVEALLTERENPEQPLPVCMATEKPHETVRLKC